MDLRILISSGALVTLGNLVVNLGGFSRITFIRCMIAVLARILASSLASPCALSIRDFQTIEGEIRKRCIILYIQ